MRINTIHLPTPNHYSALAGGALLPYTGGEGGDGLLVYRGGTHGGGLNPYTGGGGGLMAYTGGAGGGFGDEYDEGYPKLAFIKKFLEPYIPIAEEAAREALHAGVGHIMSGNPVEDIGNVALQGAVKGGKRALEQKSKTRESHKKARQY